MENSRRKFIKNAAVGSAGFMLAGSALSAKSYSQILGANDRIHVAVLGLGRRLGGFIDPLTQSSSNVELRYLCDVMASQREKAASIFADKLDYKPKLENDLRKVFADKKVDAVFNATPDHWHAPGSIMALEAGKHVYVEKPCSHNMNENELLVAAAQKYGKVVQMGNQQRSSAHSVHIINEIHKGLIGKAYKAVAFYTNKRGRVPNQQAAPVPQGLDWELFQGPAPRRAYTSETWDYNWHWYGWDYGTAEAGNNGTHEMDIARWALRVDFPNRVDVDAAKGQYLNDGWEMYDTMEATFKFDDNKSIKWDGRSRNGYDTYGYDRGTIIYGSEGSVFVNRNKYIVYDLAGKVVKDFASDQQEAGVALGGGGSASTRHAQNFFNSIRGKEQLTAPIEDASVSMAMVHYTNVAYRVGKGFDIDPSGKFMDQEALKLWAREYEKGWEI
ncbi:Gfo/Idh/MocA family protein [Reichenbachiella ulvae]|uniref:Gfo/Idh/MocA family oxidoreductase n=1 Tax=Reichenbachiella ulvae TaxID=2980104 RepID=A0ABT3CNS8_9BACT|nr:Gfo/Idh/MocA family oxidoreductase [Reichenbachiella ulvae]MCV9385274.1 Gfo/Idh/MocA family oxidoreductase [Reichenbachiella ulvae]